MFESRCGVCCESCERKKSVNCKGCTNMEIPFWGGECPVKSCCEEKGFNHCGLCNAFPCKVLSDMGKEQGYDSTSKIKMCKKWAAEK